MTTYDGVKKSITASRTSVLDESLSALAHAVGERVCVRATVVPPRDIALLYDEPVFSSHNASLYPLDGATLVILRPCCVPVGALRVGLSPSQALLEAVEDVLREGERLVGELLGAHPDMYLVGNEDERDICCVYCQAPDKPRERMSLFQSAITKLSICAFYRVANGDVFLINANAQDGQLFELLDSVREILDAHGVRAGFCGPYERSVSAFGCMEKARRAAGSARKTIQSFGECRYDEFWSKAARVAARYGFNARDFCHETLWRVRNHDRDEGSKYIQSLRAYLDSGRSLREAALRMGVHRNTMAYRVKRICELFSLDLDDGNVCFELQFSLRILEFLDASMGNGTADFYQPEASRALWDALRGKKARANGNTNARLILINVADMNDAGRFTLIRGFCNTLDESAVAFDDETIYIALAANDDSGIGAVEVVLRENGLRGIISQSFGMDRLYEQIALMRLFERYARSFSELTGPVRVSGFSSTLFYLFLGQYMLLAPFCCDEVIRVFDMDYASGTTLYTSLFAYITHYTDLKLAAREKHVHRNTLDYQIKKVLSLIGDELLDDRLRFEMMCTYRILSTIVNAN